MGILVSRFKVSIESIFIVFNYMDVIATTTNNICRTTRVQLRCKVKSRFWIGGGCCFYYVCLFISLLHVGCVARLWCLFGGKAGQWVFQHSCKSIKYKQSAELRVTSFTGLKH